jgi:hypothetical protein
MRDTIIKNLSTAIDPKVVVAIVDTYESMVSSFRRGDLDGCLTSSGKFVEHALRAVEYIRTGNAPPEIKTPAATVRQIENDVILSDSLRFLIPRVAWAMVYEIRSKRGAVHVKEIDPRHIDASLSVQAASWVIAEFLRLYHSGDERGVAEAMTELMRGDIPFVETFGGERVVTQKVPCNVELLLLLAGAKDGMDRKALGQSSKYAPPRVTVALQGLVEDRLVHKTRGDGRYHVTGTGERFLAEQLALDGKSPPVRKRA